MLYKVTDLLKSDVEGFFYQHQLTKAPIPKTTDYFFVEKVLGEKTIRGVKHYLVKYLYYPNKFNQYIPITNFNKQSQNIIAKKQK